MAKAWKDAIPVGVLDGPEGPDEITPSRARGFVQKLKAIRQAGNKIPVPWIAPKPGCNTDECNYLRSAFNAGHVDDARFDERRGMVELCIDVPGARADGSGKLVHDVTLPDGRNVTVHLGEIENVGLSDWIDGQGKRWNDVVTHAAIQPVKGPDASGYKAFLSTFVDGKIMPTLTLKQPNGRTVATFTTGGAAKPRCTKTANLSTEQRIKQSLATDFCNRRFHGQMVRLDRLIKGGIAGNAMMNLHKAIQREKATAAVNLSTLEGQSNADDLLDVAEDVVFGTAVMAKRRQAEKVRRLSTMPLSTPNISGDMVDRFCARNGLGAKSQSATSTVAKPQPARMSTAVPAAKKPAADMASMIDAFCRRHGVPV